MACVRRAGVRTPLPGHHANTSKRLQLTSAIDIIPSDFLESMKDTARKDSMEGPAEQFMDDD